MSIAVHAVQRTKVAPTETGKATLPERSTVPAPMFAIAPALELEAAMEPEMVRTPVGVSVGAEPPLLTKPRLVTVLAWLANVTVELPLSVSAWLPMLAPAVCESVAW